jgi:Sec-independent protein translocase protein TatA
MSTHIAITTMMMMIIIIIIVVVVIVIAAKMSSLRSCGRAIMAGWTVLHFAH